MMSEVAKQIENQALEHNLEGIAELIARIEQILEDVNTFMKRSQNNQIELE